jgi:SAM-dependent methyltransferase
VLPVPACPVCGETERTIVAEYNRLIFHESEWQSGLARYDYALCHGCGLVHPSRLPDRREYEHLYANFNEFLLREGRPNQFNVPDLTPKLMRDIDAQFVPLRKLEKAKTAGRPIRRRLRYDLAKARAELAVITRHMSLKRAKILHLRAKSAMFADHVKRHHKAARVDLVTLFPAHQYLAEKSPGHRVITSLDYQDFQIPFADTYDLILENHILLHMLDPNQTFAVFRAHLAEGGALYLKAELADDALCHKGKNLFAELRPFHFNHFDRATLARMLHRYGFDTIALDLEDPPEMVGLARLAGAERPCPRIGAAELAARLVMYRAWRDESILSLPRQRAAALFGSELPAAWRRVRRAGGLKLNHKGVPLSFRKVGELRVPFDALEIARAGQARRWLSQQLAYRLGNGSTLARTAGSLRRTRVAGWVGSLLRATPVGRRLRSRIVAVLPAGEKA